MDQVNKPLVVATIPVGAAEGEEKRGYAVYGPAYSLEMQIDNEWHVELVLLTVPDQLMVVTENTEMTSDEPSIVSAGAMDVEMKGGKPRLEVIDDEKNNWLLLGAPGSKDTEEVIRVKRDGAMEGGCRVIVCFWDLEGGQLGKRVQGVDAEDFGRVVAAYTGAEANAGLAAAHARKVFGDGFGTESGARLVVLCRAAADAAALTEVDGVAGVALMPEDSLEAGDALEVLRALNEAYGE